MDRLTAQDIENIKVGDTLWFAISVRTEVETAEGTNVEDMVVYSAIVRSFDMTSFERNGNRQYVATFETEDDTFTEQTFYIGYYDYYNPLCYLTREAAVAEAQKWHESAVEEAVETLERAKREVAYLTSRAQSGVREIPSVLGLRRPGHMQVINDYMGETSVA